MNFDPQAWQAIETAKRALADGACLDVATLVAALGHACEIPALAAALGLPAPLCRRAHGDQVRMEPTLAAVVGPLRRGASSSQEISATDLLRAILEDRSCQQVLVLAGVTEVTLERALLLLPPRPLPSDTIRLLSQYGRLLEQPWPPRPAIMPAESALRDLVLALGQRKRRSAVLVGPAGTGKTLLVRELARRLATRDASVPAELWSMCLFALEPHLLRMGADRPGEFESRVRALADTLVAHPRLVLFIDDLHGLLAHDRNDACQHLWREMAEGRIACIACANPAEYRQHVAADELRAVCLPRVLVSEPTHAETIAIIKARLPSIERHYGVSVPPEVIEPLVSLTEEWLPVGHQPRTAIELADLAAGACRWAGGATPTLTQAQVVDCVERRTGGSISHAQTLTSAKIFAALSTCLLGQSETLKDLADSFAAKLGPFASRRGPRGVFLLAGPTGVGKTQAALELARLLGGGRDCLVRVNANVLGGSNGDLDPARAELFGPPPGFKGYGDGKSGILTRVRDLRETLVLFDEIEKAPPGVGDLLLQILGEGRGQDVDGQDIDFRRSFIVFTTNAGDTKPIIGPHPGGSAGQPKARDVQAALRRMGFGNEFLGRIDHTFVFQPLDRTAIQQIFALRFRELDELLRRQGRILEIPEGLATAMASAWQSEFGARNVNTQFESRLRDRLNLALQDGRLNGIRKVRAVLAREGATATTRKVEEDTLVIEIPLEPA